ncbi:Serine carboxypeptidase S28 [Rhizoctonia solani]|uniref:Serine carboxypeptidase S28 n=1 Tax=Rhizoctonia solani TaxID=456999 RepID=A0A8H8NSF9_9AGAM|nr:Serine carboxypeptidase S28 [Rhizoctonia solani]QRW17932.1 Serine carboxypeptidase S28 [Rhizoctonia solani]
MVEVGSELVKSGSSQDPPQGQVTRRSSHRLDEEVLVDAQPPMGFTRALIITTACTLAMVMSGASISIALPDIGVDLGISQSELQWLISSYALTSGCFLLLFGRLADLFGRKKVFLAGTVWSLAWSLGSGFAPNSIALNVMRALHGMGSAATVPSAIGILAHEFPPSRSRSITFATFSAGAPLGGAIGFVIGGVMTEYTSVAWRGVFYVSAGVAGLTMLAAALAIHKDEPSTEKDRRVDWVGAVLSTTALVLLTFSLAQSSSVKDGWRTPYIPAVLVVSVLLLVCFVSWEYYLETRTTHPPLMRLGLWTRANGRFAAVQLIVFFDWACFTTWLFFVTLYYQEYKGISPVGTTVRVLPMAVSGLLCNLVVALVVGRISGTALIAFGCFFTALASLLFALIVPSASYWAFGFPAAAVVVFGADFMFATGSLFVAKIALPHEQSLAGGIFNTVNQLGTAFGLAIASVVSDTVHRRALRESGDELGSLLRGYRAAFWTCFGFGTVALVLTVIFLRGIGIVGHQGGEGHGNDNNGSNRTTSRSGHHARLYTRFGSQGVNLWNLHSQLIGNKVQAGGDQESQQFLLSDASGGKDKLLKAQYFKQPLDHFDKSVNSTFGQRYWVNKEYYEPGGPVFVLDGGETSGEDRLPFLQTGILAILANATKGLGIVLEHRYYGESIPVADFSTDSMRWLTNAQALQDSANFIANVKIEGLDYNVTAPGTKWIYYGGSYAGARAAHMRVLYPHLVHGAIASSAVTHAAIDYWEYADAVRRTADPVCIGHLTTAIQAIDDLLSTRVLAKSLKSWFELGELESDQDFVSVLMSPIGYVQGQNWDSAVGSDEWSRFCAALGSGGADSTLGWCFGTRDDSKFRLTDLGQEWRAWTWQVCTEWGYFMGAPPNQAYPTIVSRRLTLDYTSAICRQAFPPGEHISVPDWPNVTAVNALGDYGLSADRLAFIDGDEDPWLPATPHSPHAPERADTVLRPFKLIRTGVHHHDENGVEPHSEEPAHIQAIHRQEIEFVKAWLKGTTD